MPVCMLILFWFYLILVCLCPLFVLICPLFFCLSTFTSFYKTCKKDSCVLDVVVCWFQFMCANRAVNSLVSIRYNLCCLLCLYMFLHLCVCFCVLYVPDVEISRLQHLCRLLLHRKWIAVVGLSTSIKNNPPHESTFVLLVVAFICQHFYNV